MDYKVYRNLVKVWARFNWEDYKCSLFEMNSTDDKKRYTRRIDVSHGGKSRLSLGKMVVIEMCDFDTGKRKYPYILAGIYGHADGWLYVKLIYMQAKFVAVDHCISRRKKKTSYIERKPKLNKLFSYYMYLRHTTMIGLQITSWLPAS